MKILADSNIFIDFWKNPTQEIIDIFENEDVVICGAIKSELLHGARSLKDFQDIDEALNEFEVLSFETNDWRELGNILYELRTHGLTVPFQDAMIALLAIKNDIPVWTNDRHFVHMKDVIKKLKIYHDK